MKKLILFLVFVLFSYACNNEQDFEDTGIVTGYDLALCACCGGYFIEIDGENYRTFDLPAVGGFNIDDNPMPFNILLNWELDTQSPCFSMFDNLIVVEDYELE